MKILLLKEVSQGYTKLLDVAEIPQLENISEIPILAKAIGRLLKDYVEVLKDPNLVSILLDGSIEDWTIIDLESVQAILAESGMLIVYGQVDEGTSIDIIEDSVLYMMVDRSILYLGFIPELKFSRVSLSNFNLIDVMKNLFSNYNYFTSSKFVSNILENLFDIMSESYTLLGTYDPQSFVNFSNLLQIINKKIYSITKD